MESPPHADSARALARAPLFARLGRVDRARLAGELEELRFAPGATIVREGDPADGLYVINAGEVDVVVGARPGETGRAGVLGPGEVFGEMALLTDSPRTATVVARTDVTVWRLSRARFDALLDHERGIARAIERALSQRLALSTHEAGALRATARGLAGAALDGLGPRARRLAAGVALRPAWAAGVLDRACAATGDGPALEALRALPGFLRESAGRVLVDGAFVALVADRLGTPDPSWLRAASTELAPDDPVGAVDLALRAVDREQVDRLIEREEARLAERATAPDLERWSAWAGSAGPGFEARLARLREQLARRPAGTLAGPRVATRPGRLVRLLARVRRIGAGRLVGAGGALAIFLAGTLAPVPAGLDRPGLVALAAILATVPLLMADALPDYVIMLLLTVALVVPGLVPPAAILAGFATPAWLMILTLLAVGVAISRSGLMFRLVLLSVQRLPPSYLAQSLVLAGTGVALTAGLTSTATRIALGVPIARGIADAMGFGRQSPGAAAVGLLTFFTFSQMGTLFMTGTFTGLVVHDLLPAAARSQVTWWRWFFVALPPWVLMLAGYYALLWVRFQPQRHARVNLAAIRTQQALLGPLTLNEMWSAATLLVLVVGFATREYHGIAPAWLAVGLFVALFVLGVLDASAVQAGGALGLLVYAGVILSLGDVFAALRIDVWLGSVVRSGMPGFVANPYGFVLVVAAIAFVLHFFVPWMTASTILALVTMPLAEGLGFHPFVPVMVALIAGDHTLVPYVNSSYAMLYFASEGELFGHDQARVTLWVETAVRLAAVVASVPAWQLMGLM